jgi:hypothetical protein
MIVETYLFSNYVNEQLKKDKKLKDYKQKREGYVKNSTVKKTDDSKMLGLGVGMFIILIILSPLILFGLFIWAVIDVIKNCTNPTEKMIHLILLFISSGTYLPLYGILRLSKVICKK